MRASTAYFAGAGTVIAAIAGGIGGGLLFADMISPQGPKQEMTKLEQRMSSQPIQVKADPEPVVNPAATPPTTRAAVPAAPAPTPTQTEAANGAPAAAPAAETAATAQPAAPAIQSEAPSSQPAVQPKQAAAPEDSRAKAKPEDSVAKAKPEDSLAKAEDADIKRAAVDKRKVDRRRQWSERRRKVQRRDQELLEFEEKVREETEGRPIFASEPRHAEMPRIRLFGLD